MNSRKRTLKEDKSSRNPLKITSQNSTTTQSAGSKENNTSNTPGVTESVTSVGGTTRMSGGFSGLSESCNLSARQAKLLSNKRAAEELELARQQELEAEAEAEAECSKKEQPLVSNWSDVDKDVFFQGVLTCGRDFEKLYKFCLTKIKAKDLEERSKDQIRSFYYRMAKNFRCVQKKTSRNKKANELFILVNAAEFRRRGIPNPLTKHSEFLTQLIYNGETKFRQKGKTVKIRTPVCAPLTRLIEKAKEDAKAAIADKDKKKTAIPVAKAPRLPEFVTVELQPNNNAACQRMSDISHNPNLRVKVKCEQSLSTLIESLEKKWVPSSVRFRRELNMEEEWDRLPYIRVRPSAQAKLQPFDISLASNNTQTIVSFNEYLRITKEDGSQNRDEKGEEPSREKERGDPAKFLKDKLTNITAQLQGESSNGADSDGVIQGDPETKSQEWIAEAASGWTMANSKDLTMGCLYLLFGSPEKLVLDYEWPELERSDEVIHMFAGMINRLINVAETEFTSQTTKKKLMNNTQNSPTTRSPSTRGPGRPRSSPSTPKSIVNIKPAPAKDSPEFKKPGIPTQSENRQLADAIALGRQELRPYARRRASRPVLVQKKLLPSPLNPGMNKQTQNLNLVGAMANVGKTQVMDISCMTIGSSGVKYNIAGEVTSSSGSKPSSPLRQVKSSQPNSPLRKTLKSMITSQTFHDLTGATSTGDDVMNSLSHLISSTPSSNRSAEEFNQLQSLMTDGVNNEDSTDILTQAMASIKTPVKRRITPMTLSTTVEGVVFQGSQDKPSTVINDNKSHQGKSLSDSISEHSLSSLLKSIHPANHSSTEEGLLTGGLEHHSSPVHGYQSTGAAPTGFQGLINGVGVTSGLLPSQSKAPDSQLSVDTHPLPVKDAWLTPDIAMVDFSLSSLLGEKSPRRDVTDPAALLSLSKSITSAATGGILSGVSIPDRPASVLSSDDTRMSFLNKLDVGDLGMGDSTLPHLIGGDSIDYMAKFESLAASLETPQKSS